MVYFTCNACGEQVKKPQVEKHYTQKCRACNVLTCIDCLKDFVGDEYKTHVTCMSEDQRYSKEGRAGWDPAVGQGNKGDKKQTQWTNNLRRILAETTDIDSDVRNILNTIQEHENIPRKKPKFINFVKNIMRNRARPHSIDKTWELFEQALRPAVKPEPEVMDTKENIQEAESKEDEEVVTKKSKKEKKKEKMEKAHAEINGQVSQEENSEKENQKVSKKKKKKNKETEVTEEKMDLDADIDLEDKKASKKRKREENGEESINDGGESSPKKSKFDWDEVITECLKTKEGNEMKLSKLKKKCVNEFFSRNEETHKTAEEIGAKFDKKLKKRKYRLLKDRVKLITDDASGEEAEVEQGPPEKPPSWVSAPPSQPEKPTLSFNKWEGADMGSSAQTEKFRRLMGIKTAPKLEDLKGVLGAKRDDKKIFRDLEQGFEKARETHFGGRSFTM